MASVAKYRDDVSGSIVTTGTSTAYIVSSNQDFDTLSDFNGQMIAFTPHATNGAGPVTMTVDGFANLPLRSAPNVELQSGVLVQGTPYMARFNQSDNTLYLMSFFGSTPSPALIPIGASLEFWGTGVPNSSFAFPFGQAISRTTYATLFGIVGTTYGTGDGSTTFNLPDVRGRLTPALDNMGGTAAGRLTNSGTGNSGINGVALGASGGAQSEVLVTANLPPYTPAGTITNVVSPSGALSSASAQVAAPQSGNELIIVGSAITVASTFNGTPQGGTSVPVVTMPPSIVCNRILRII